MEVMLEQEVMGLDPLAERSTAGEVSVLIS